MTRLELFRQQAPEFNVLPDTVINAWFSSALIYMDTYLTSISAVKLDLAVALYSAHLCWLNKYPANGGASRGPIVSEKDNQKEKKYQAIQNSDTWLQQSVYGQSFYNLTKLGTNSRSAILTRFGT